MMNDKIKEVYLLILRDKWWPHYVGGGTIRFQLEEFAYHIDLDVEKDGPRT
jgi:hypothetical protein